jgi:hypothetical protein
MSDAGAVSSKQVTLQIFRSRLILAMLGPALCAAHKRRAALAALGLLSNPETETL